MSNLARTSATRRLASAAASSSSHAGRITASSAKYSTLNNTRICCSHPTQPHAGPSRSPLVLPCSKRTLATTTTSSPTISSDIVIVGGGVVGLGLACDLIASQAVEGASSITLVEGSDLSRLRSRSADRAAPPSHNGSSPHDGSSPHGSAPSPSGSGDGIDWENRVISLTSSNLSWLQSIGVYPYLLHHRLRPINSMRVWDGLSGALLDFDSPSDSSSISVMVEISNLQQAMLRYLEEGPGKSTCSIIDGAKVETILPGSKVEPEGKEADPWPVIHLSTGQFVQARLLVGADGSNSPVKKYAGIGDYGWSYDRRGLVGTLRCKGSESGEPGVGHTAYQRFLPSGTIAFLPLSDRTASMVWTLPPDIAAALTLLHRDTAGSGEEPLARLVDAAFRLPWSHIERLFERVLAYSKYSEGKERDWSWLSAEIPTEAEWVERGLGEQPLPESGAGEVPPKVHSIDTKSVASFPLNLKHADAYLGSNLNSHPLRPSGLLAGAMSAFGLAPGGAGQGAGRGRTVLVGDAAHTIHPLAGQGLNLGIADIRSLSKTLKKAVGDGADVGSYNALKGYGRERYWQNQMMLSAVDHLHWLYASPVPGKLQADKGREQRERDGLVRGLVKEGLGRAVVAGRSVGLEVVNELGWVKERFMRQAGSRSFSTSSSPFGRQVRHHSTQASGPLASDAYTASSGSASAATTSTPSLASLTPSQRRALRDMLRVDHSGEIAANTIYAGQADIFGALGDKHNRDMAVQMGETEKKHLEVMRALLRQHNVRPSALVPVWAVAGRILGGVTALLGPRSAMACTEAVESVIGEHYDDQLKELEGVLGGKKVHESLPLLRDIIKEFRDDELEHLDTAVENESQQAAGHALLSAVIAKGCRGAIWVASRV